MNCTSYTFTVVIDKALPGQIYSATMNLIVGLFAFAQVFIKDIVKYLTPYFDSGVKYCGTLCESVMSFVLPVLQTPYIDQAAIVFAVLIVVRYLYNRCTKARSCDNYENDFVEKELQNGQSLDDETDPGDGLECDCRSCGGDKDCCEDPTYKDEHDELDDDQDQSDSEPDDERKDPTYNPESDSDFSDSDDEREEALIAKAFAGGREGVLPEDKPRRARRTGRTVKPPVDKVKTHKQMPVKTAPSKDEEYIVNPLTGRYVLKTTKKGKQILKAQMGPRRPANSYIWFCKDNREKITQANPGLSNIQIVSVMATQWKELSGIEKAKYQALANEDKIRYMREMHEYERI
jgi:hypothetical protein